jgi:hypothetical protein
VLQPDYVVFSRNEQLNEAAQPWLGYFNYSNVKDQRWQKLKPPLHPGEGCNAAGRSKALRKLSRITPNEWSRDPYLVCILLSIAQLQARSVEPSALHVVSSLSYPFSYNFRIHRSLGLFAHYMPLITQVTPSRYDRLGFYVYVHLRGRNFIRGP